MPSTAPNILLTLTCGNAKCAYVINEAVVSADAAPNLKQVMATQQIQCPNCMKVGRNHVRAEETDEDLEGDATLRSNRESAPDIPRRTKPGQFQRKSSTPQERGARRRGARAAGKTAIPPMSARQQEKLARRGQADGMLAAKGRPEVERARTNQPQVPTPQPGADGTTPSISRNAAPPTTSRAGRAGRTPAAPTADPGAREQPVIEETTEIPVLEQPVAPQPPVVEDVIVDTESLPPVAPPAANPDTPAS